MGLADEVRAEHVAKSAAASAKKATHQAQVDASWQVLVDALNAICPDVAAACVELNAKSDVKGLFRRGWVFYLGFGFGGREGAGIWALVQPGGGWSFATHEGSYSNYKTTKISESRARSAWQSLNPDYAEPRPLWTRDSLLEGFKRAITQKLG
ncbi:hypothetical protein ACFYV7_39310 [Nocardia suismassiliense]|uniref:Uncharacterized protein n=1 Tax=Nocardia suismassiliense TaxID=2077092 RepID=A0ABW6R728_9NOCA